MNLDDLAQREPQHVMVFGRSKVGKSTLASKLAEAGFNLKWFSLDNGHRVLYKLSAEARKRIDVIPLPDTRDFPIASDVVRKLLRGDALELCHAHGAASCSVCKKAAPAAFSKYDFKQLSLQDIVVLDHLTQLTDSCMAHICKGKEIDYKPKLDDWGSLKFHMSAMLSSIQNASYNVVCIAQEMEAEMEDGSKLLTPQVGSREFGKMVGSYFDHIVYCEVLNKSHRAGSATTYKISALTGSRSDVKVEDQKELSLLPFFDGSVVAEKQEADKKEAKLIMATVAKSPVASAMAGVIEKGPAPVSNSILPETAVKPLQVISKEAVNAITGTANPAPAEKSPSEIAKEKLAALKLAKR